jgi:dyslexia susceptibility 1 candidate gene 1 protein
MPIPIFASYTWQETEGTVTISSRIPGATPANTDFFASPHYVKANSSQVAAGGGLFILESDLFAEIDPKRSAATVSGGMVEIRLHKTTPALWGQLNVQALDKAERMRRRKRSIDAAERAAAADAEASKTAKWEQSRHTLNSQMQLDRAYRGVLEERKSVERAHEEAALDEWQSATERARLDELKQRYGARATAAAAGAVAEAMASPATPHAAAPAAPPRALPPVRARAVIECTFTPKMTAAPLRTKGQHADYDPEPVPLDAPGLRGGGMGPSRARALASGDLYDISQRDPAWLKDRGDRFYRLSDFESAANSYTAVLEQFRDKIPAQAVDCYLACLSNRSACRLQQGELVDAAADATHALSLAESGKSISNIPLTDDELRARARARMQRLLLRRGAALARLGLLEHALADYELALADYAPEGGIGAGAGAHVASPSDLSAGAVRAQLRADVERLREALAALLEAKRRADALAAAATAAAAELGGDGDGGDGAGGEGGGEGGAAESARADAAHALAIDALDAYVDALAGAPFHLGCLANGAAAALFAGAHAKCVAWCDSALRIADAGVVGGAVCAVRVRVKLLLRRATAKTELGCVRCPLGARVADASALPLCAMQCATPCATPCAMRGATPCALRCARARRAAVRACAFSRSGVAPPRPRSRPRPRPRPQALEGCVRRLAARVRVRAVRQFDRGAAARGVRGGGGARRRARGLAQRHRRDLVRRHPRRGARRRRAGRRRPCRTD